jgi:hypothetical protein
LSFEQYEHIVGEPCYYCDITEPEKGFNGIDRKKNSYLGYIVENCVSCCKMCNKLKGTLDDICFIKRIGHILSYIKVIDINVSFPELFGNHIAGKYKKFMRIARERQLVFELSSEQFDEITAENCYICGKQNTEIHKNGIDRFDNNIGYIIENCRPCCTECNFMKGIYNYIDFMEKLQFIYNKHFAKYSGHPLGVEGIRGNSRERSSSEFQIFQHNTISDNYMPEIFIQKHQKRRTKEIPSITKTAEQIKEEVRQSNQKQRDEIKERLGHIKYKEIREIKRKIV